MIKNVAHKPVVAGTDLRSVLGTHVVVFKSHLLLTISFNHDLLNEQESEVINKGQCLAFQQDTSKGWFSIQIIRVFGLGL